MANVLVFGAELNWWLKYGRKETEEPPRCSPSGSM